MAATTPPAADPVCTPAQARVLVALAVLSRGPRGFATVRDVSRACGCSSYNGAHYHLKQLARVGLAERVEPPGDRPRRHGYWRLPRGMEFVPATKLFSEA
jgi:hypothetical protein